MRLKPLTCGSCGEHLGYIDECDNQSDFYCDDCAATFTAIDGKAIDALKDNWGLLTGKK